MHNFSPRNRYSKFNFVHNNNIGLRGLRTLSTKLTQKPSFVSPKLSSSIVKDSHFLPQITLSTPRRFLSEEKKSSILGDIEALDFPTTPANALMHCARKLTSFEQGEILDYPEVYFLGLRSKKIVPKNSGSNFGYDDAKGEYAVVLGDHLAYRYEVLEVVGKGSFGQVCKCMDHKRKETVAIKIIRNKKRFFKQGKVEVSILEHIRKHDTDEQSNIIHMKNHFVFRSHLCITFELLSANLYELLKVNSFRGMSLGLLKKLSQQLLASLLFMQKHKIIHCDFKPENILLKNPNKSAIKVIDFGSSCFESKRIFTYIQSRFYRAPEIMLGLDYSTSIDMWSFGCVLAELYSGYPLMPGENENDQMLAIMEVRGTPPSYLLKNASRVKHFFDDHSRPIVTPNSRGVVRYPGSKTIADKIRCSDLDFLDFIDSNCYIECLEWDPLKRITPDLAAQHPWITTSL